MPIFVAMLRGINVGGHKKIKMEQLRASFEAMGFRQVKTYIQSGNVVFKTDAASAANLSKKIVGRILADFGHSVSVILRTAEEMDHAIVANPLLKETGIDIEKLHVVFLSDAPDAAAVKKVEEFVKSPERIRCVGKELYFFLPNGVADSVLMKKPIDRLLGVTTTARNWKTVNTLNQMCRECA
jgi:uncharacterized protein (DUF1697 family)